MFIDLFIDFHDAIVIFRYVGLYSRFPTIVAIRNNAYYT